MYIDNRKVTPFAEAKSIGTEQTFQQDTTDFAYLKDVLLLTAQKLSFDVKLKGIYAHTVTLKVTYADMKSITRSKSGDATDRAQIIYETAAALLDKIERRPIRLIGITLSNFTTSPNMQMSLFDAGEDEQQSKLDDALLKLQKKYGRGIVKPASVLGQRKESVKARINFMELSQAIENIKNLPDALPADEIMCIRENKEAAIPLLMDFVVDVIKTCKELDEWHDDIEDPAIALFLLAEFGATEAFPLFAEILEFEDDKADWLVYDILSEDFGGMTASVASEKDVQRIKAIADNESINVYQRLTAVNVLIGMYARGICQRSDLVDFLAHLLDNYIDDGEFIDCFVDKCHHVAATEVYERIRKIFATTNIMTLFVAESDFAADEPIRLEEDVIASLQKRSDYGVVTDTLSAISGWDCFNNDDDDFGTDENSDDDSIWIPPTTNRINSTPINNTPIINEPKIGRNAPCPCGSGQKYKRCCGVK